MVTVTLKFNEEKLKNLGRTVDEMLEPIRESMKSYDVEEVEQGVFQKTGRDGLVVLDCTLDYMDDHPEYLDYLDDWLLDIDGEAEDCKAELISYNKEHGRS
ncbi:hypothetical protein [Selenomonas ruminantium]|uniref:Uncharacterized protein n=1 Tax=Selenomonas ruminantium TaxID=971 RepID=A0A1K1LUG6_SELRU|nr:hypothetical protein [Selenomonas ruminantium]SFW14499.1 hypothetical protein SAMN02910323_0351 [Selenomonas ruminantium]